MWYSMAILGLLLLLALPLLPLPRLRQAALGLLYRLVQLSVLGGLLMAAVLFLQPEWTPPWLAPLLEQWQQLAPRARPELLWLLLALVVWAAGLVALVLLDFAQRVTAYTLMVRRLLGEVGGTLQRLAQSVEEPNGSRAGLTDRVSHMSSAIRSMGEVATDQPAPTRRRKLIELMKS